MANSEKFEYLKLEYETGFNAVKTWIDARYRMFQLVAFLNVGALTLSFQENLLFSGTQRIAGILISIACFLITLIGLATELANRKYNVSYFKTLRDIELELNQTKSGTALVDIGLFNAGRKYANKGFWRKLLNVDRLHIVYYVAVLLLWLGILLAHFFIV